MMRRKPTREELTFAEHGSACLCCGTTEGVVVDHVIPNIAAGLDDLSNWQPLCASCNARKGATDTDYRKHIPTEPIAAKRGNYRPNRTTLEIPPQLRHWLDAEAERRGIPVAHLILTALEQYLDRRAPSLKPK